MKLIPSSYPFLACVTTRIAFVGLVFSLHAAAASLDLANDPATGGPGKFAIDEIQREAVAKGMTLGDEGQAVRIALTVGKDANASAQSYSIRVQNEGGRRVITVRGACALALFDASGDQFEHAATLRHLGDALTHWKRYAAIRDAHYVPALYNRVGYVDITALTEKVAADLDIARTWKPGALKDDGKRSGTEKGFRK